jgi:glutaredoxin-like protein
VSAKSLILEDSKGLADRYNVRRAPATVVTLEGDGQSPALKFYGLPSGYEFSALLNDISDIANSHPSSLSTTTIDEAKKVRSKVHIQVFVTPTCPYCPKAVRTAHQLSMANPEMIDSEMIESMEFPELSERYSVMAVPKIVINENVEFEGALPEQMFLSKIKEAIAA